MFNLGFIWQLLYAWRSKWLIYHSKCHSDLSEITDQFMLAQYLVGLTARQLSTGHKEPNIYVLALRQILKCFYKMHWFITNYLIRYVHVQKEDIYHTDVFNFGLIWGVNVMESMRVAGPLLVSYMTVVNELVYGKLGSNKLQSLEVWAGMFKVDIRFQNKKIKILTCVRITGCKLSMYTPSHLGYAYNLTGL